MPVYSTELVVAFEMRFRKCMPDSMIWKACGSQVPIKTGCLPLTNDRCAPAVAYSLPTQIR